MIASKNNSPIILMLVQIEINFLFLHNSTQYIIYNPFFSGGDDKRVLLWNTGEMCKVKSAQPIVMKGEHFSNIFSAVFDCSNKFIFSAGNCTYLYNNII